MWGCWGGVTAVCPKSKSWGVLPLVIVTFYAFPVPTARLEFSGWEFLEINSITWKRASI